MLQELQVLKRLEHPNIIWLYEIIDDNLKNKDLYLITEFYSKGSIGDQLKKLNKKDKPLDQDGKPRYKGIKEWQVRFYLIDMLKALHYCHKCIHVVHKDIKPDNIMIGADEQAVLIDFGVAALQDPSDAERKEEMLKLKAGTYMFFAPELFASDQTIMYGEKTDIWALGITFY